MERLGVSDLTDPYSNILVAADYLEELFQKSDGDIYLVLMKYNMKHGRQRSCSIKESFQSIPFWWNTGQGNCRSCTALREAGHDKENINRDGSRRLRSTFTGDNETGHAAYGYE